MGTSQHTVQPSESLFGSHNIGTVFHRYTTSLIPALGSSSRLDPRPMESNTGVGYPRALTGAPPCGDQIPPVVSSGDISITHSLVSTLGGAQDGHSINRACGVPDGTPQALSQSSSGRCRGINTPTSNPVGQGDRVPNVSVPPATLESQIEAHVHTRHEGVNQVVDGTLLERVIPANGPITGVIPIAILGKNFPNNIPLYVRFGNNVAEAVSHGQYQSTCTNISSKIYDRRGATSIH